MPFRRRYAKRSVRRYRKKIFKRKRMMRRSAADKGHLEKLSRTFPITVDAAGNLAYMTVHWLATGVSGQNEVFHTGAGANLSEQFGQCAGMFREYRISSMKLEYRPVHIDAGNGNGFAI